MLFGGKSRKRKRRQSKRSRRAGAPLPNAPHVEVDPLPNAPHVAVAASKVVSGTGEFRPILEPFKRTDIAFEDKNTGIVHKYSTNDLAEAAESPNLEANLQNQKTKIPVHKDHIQEVKNVLKEHSKPLQTYEQLAERLQNLIAPTGVQHVGGRQRHGKKSRRHGKKSRRRGKKSRRR